MNSGKCSSNSTQRLLLGTQVRVVRKAFYPTRPHAKRRRQAIISHSEVHPLASYEGGNLHRAYLLEALPISVKRI